MKIFNFQFFRLRRICRRQTIFNFRKGFTMVELLVAVGLFVLLISLSAVGFIRALRTQRAVVALMEANDNASVVLEQMTREIRTGTNFSKTSPAELRFLNSYDQTVLYRWNEEAIERGMEDEFFRKTYKRITADNLKINRFNIGLIGADAGDGYPPRITISFSVGIINKYLEGVSTDVQATISARIIDT